MWYSVQKKGKREDKQNNNNNTQQALKNVSFAQININHVQIKCNYSWLLLKTSSSLAIKSDFDENNVENQIMLSYSKILQLLKMAFKFLFCFFFTTIQRPIILRQLRKNDNQRAMLLIH